MKKSELRKMAYSEVERILDNLAENQDLSFNRVDVSFYEDLVMKKRR